MPTGPGPGRAVGPTPGNVGVGGRGRSAQPMGAGGRKVRDVQPAGPEGRSRRNGSTRLFEVIRCMDLFSPKITFSNQEEHQ